MAKKIFLELTGAITQYISSMDNIGHLGFTFLQNPELDNFNLNNIFELLFNSDYSFTDVVTKFKKLPKAEIENSDLKLRLQIKSDVIVYVSDEEGEDIFEFNQEEQDMINELLNFRNLDQYNVNSDWTTYNSPLSWLIWAEIQDTSQYLSEINNIINLILSQINNYPEVRQILYKLLILRCFINGLYKFS